MTDNPTISEPRCPICGISENIPSPDHDHRANFINRPTVSEPRTDAGRAHRRYLHAIVHGPNPDGSYDCKGGCECHVDILAIEAEAAQPIDGLREALQRAYEPGRSTQWRSGYLYAESIALAAARLSGEKG